MPGDVRVRLERGDAEPSPQGVTGGWGAPSRAQAHTGLGSQDCLPQLWRSFHQCQQSKSIIILRPALKKVETFVSRLKTFFIDQNAKEITLLYLRTLSFHRNSEMMGLELPRSSRCMIWTHLIIWIIWVISTHSTAHPTSHLDIASIIAATISYTPTLQRLSCRLLRCLVRSIEESIAPFTRT